MVINIFSVKNSNIKASCKKPGYIKRLLAIFVLYSVMSGISANTSENSTDQQNQYAIALLHQALDSTSYRAKPKASVAGDLKLSTDKIDVMWAPANRIAFDSPHHVIKIPVFRGLLSYYSVIYHKASVANLARVGFKDYEIGMLQHDAMAEALQKQGMKVVKTRAVGSLVQMLNKARFEAMITPTAEVKGVKVTDAYQTPQQIAMLHNPWYFVVHKDNPELAQALELGLHQMLKNGSLDELLEKTQWMQAVIKHLAEHQPIILNSTFTRQYKSATNEAVGFWYTSEGQEFSGSQLVSVSP